MKTLTASVAGLALVAGAYFAVQTSVRDPDERKASFICWWVPGDHLATVTWRFGGRPPGSEIVRHVTRNAPFGRKTGSVRIGDSVRITVTFGVGQPLTGPGLSTACVVKAGRNVVPFQEPSHRRIDRTVLVA